MNNPDNARITVSITVDQGYDTVAEASVSERLVLAAEGSPYDPAVGIIEQMTREAINKTTAQLTTIDHLSQREEPAPAPPA